jgi:hypothetical protein
VVWTFVAFQFYGLFTDPGFTPVTQTSYQQIGFVNPETPMGLIPGTSDEAKGTSDYAMFPVIALRKADLDTETGVFSIVDVTENYTVKMSYFSSE